MLLRRNNGEVFENILLVVDKQRGKLHNFIFLSYCTPVFDFLALGIDGVFRLMLA